MRKPLVLALLALIVVGLLGGVAVGLYLAWNIWPTRVTNIDPGDLSGMSQDEYIVLTASTYGYDQDLSKARERLAALHDANIGNRVAQLAKQLSSRNSQDAAGVASLAVALGNREQSVALIAAMATPLPVAATATGLASPTALSTITLTPTPTRTPPPSSTPSITPTRTRTPTARGSATRTVKPATATPKPPVSTFASTQWIPPYPGEWPPGVNLVGANVAAGQQYWHLVRAIYCDYRDERNDCPNRPGGDEGTNIYVMLLGAGGGRATAPILVKKDDGSFATPNDIGPEKSADDSCQCNYAYLATNWPLSVGGAPSDTVYGMGLYSVRAKLRQWHTRYYFWFQLVTR